MPKYETEVHRGDPLSCQSVAVDLIGADKRVLDVGCATGYTGRALMELGCTVVGIERDAEAAAVAAKDLERVLGLDLESADLVAELGEASFDVVLFGDVLEHLTRPATVLRAARRLLRPRGFVVASIPNIAHGDVRLALLAGIWQYRELGLLDDTHLRFFTLAGIERLMADSGFALADVRRIPRPLFGSELGIQEVDFPSAVVDLVRASPEHDVYQYVVRAVPDDADGHLGRLAARERELAAAVRALTGRVGGLESELLSVVDRLALAEAERDVQMAEAVQARRELTTLQSIRTLRYARRGRALYGRLRALR